MANPSDPSNPHNVVDTSFTVPRLGSAAALRAHTQEEAHIIARKLHGTSLGATEIDQYMRSQGLVPMINRSRAYSPVSATKRLPKHVGIIPYTPTHPDSTVVGGIGMSDGEPASGIIVHLKGNAIATITTVDFLGGNLITKNIDAHDLLLSGPKKFVEPGWKRGHLPRDLNHEHSSSIASDAFHGLLFDQHSTLVHTPADMKDLVHLTPVVTAIAELQYMRLEGAIFSPDVSCCSCCCCCWGSCSSCSAVASHYVNESYQPQFVR